MTVEDYTIEQFKEEFEDSSTLQGKHDAILKATGYCVEFAPDVDPEFLGVVKEYKQHLIDIKKEFVKEEDVICMKDIEDGKYELYTCIKSFELTPDNSTTSQISSNKIIEEGTRYYVRIEDPKSHLGEMWSLVATDEIKTFINNIKPIIWIIVDNGIGTPKSRNAFRGDFETYFKQ